MLPGNLVWIINLNLIFGLGRKAGITSITLGSERGRERERDVDIEKDRAREREKKKDEWSC